MYMQADPTSPVPAWRIVRVEDTTALVGASPMAVKRVWLHLFDNTDTHIDVPVSDYNAATVKRMADVLTANHAEVVGLQGELIQLGG